MDGIKEVILPFETIERFLQAAKKYYEWNESEYQRHAEISIEMDQSIKDMEVALLLWTGRKI